MANINNFDANMIRYFNTLPKFVQETIMMSNSDIESYDDLVRCSENMLKEDK